MQRAKQAKHEKSKRLRSIMALALALVLCFAAVYKAAPNRVEAEAGVFSYKTVHVQTTIDPETLQVVGAMVSQKYNLMEATDELKRIGGTAMDALLSSNNSFLEAVKRIEEMGNAYEPPSSGMAGVNKRLLTFPQYSSVVVGTTIRFNRVADASAEDEALATKICNELISSLNQAFSFANNGNYVASGSNKEEKVQNYKNDMTRFLKAVATVYSSGYNTVSSYVGSDGTVAKIHGAAGSDDIVIEINGLTQKFMFQMATDGHSNIDKVNWGHLAFEAFVGYYVLDESLQVSIDNVYTGKASSFEELLVSLFNNLANWIRNTLGLWDIDKLVFNLGGRAAPSYVGGVYPASWERTVWTLFFVSEIVAFVVLAITLMTNVLRKIMSTVNPIIRTSLIDQAKDLLIVAFALGALPLLLQLITNISSTLTGVFGDMITYTGSNGTITENAFSERFRILSVQGGTLGGVLMQFLYLAVTISFNVLYIIRSYVIAILIILAPVFVVLFAMDDNKKILAKTWLMELLSNVFIQPVHGFVLGVVLLLPGSSRPVEALVMLYCVLPISSIIRNLFFGSAGASPLQMAKNGIKSFKGNATTAFRTGMGAAKYIDGKAHDVVSSLGKKEKSSSESGEATARTGEQRGEAEANPSTFTTRKSTGGIPAGTQVLPSQKKTPREKMVGEINEKGQIPSVGFQGESATETGMPGMKTGTSDIETGIEAGVPSAAFAGAAMAGTVMMGDDPEVTGRPQKEELAFLSHGVGSDMSGVVRRLPSPDGKAQYSVSGQDMYGAGLSSLCTKREGGNSYMTTDTGFRGFNADGSHRIATGKSVYSAADAKNYADMAKVFESGTEAQKDVLRRAGYDFVGAETKGGTPTGRFTVSTNKNFKNAMGYDMSARKDGGMDISTAQGTPDSMPRTPDVGTMLSPQSYQRTMEDGRVGYTATGMNLQQEEGLQAPSVMPVSEGIQQPDGGYEIPMSAMENAGIIVAPAENGGVAMTYDAGIMGYDSDGAAVYAPESAMVMADRQSVAQIQRTWEQGSDADRAQLNALGIQSVATQDDGHVTITYNETAQQAMGGQIIANNDHVIVKPTATEAPVQTVLPIQVQPNVRQVLDVAYQPEQAAQVRVTPIQASAPVKVSVPTQAPTTPQIERSGIMEESIVKTGESFVEMEKPGVSQRMQRRQNAAKHDRSKGSRGGKRGRDWDDDYDW